MSDPRRKARWRRRRAVAVATVDVTSTHLTPSYRAAYPLDWIPDLDNAHLLNAARGLSSIGLPLHPPAMLTLPRRHGRSRC